MQRIEVGRYNDPEKVGGYAGWINPEREDGNERGVPEWILFIKDDGTVQLCVRNDKGELEF